MIDMLEALKAGEVDVEQAGVAGKLCEGILSSVKIELQYAHMTNQTPACKFLEDKPRAIEGKAIKQLKIDNKKR